MSRKQTLVQLSDELVAALDERAARHGVSRSHLIREALESYLETGSDAEIDAAIVEGYARIPPPQRDPWAEAAAIRSIKDEPW